MALQDFINQHNGQYLDFDGAYGAQCVDLANYWAQAIGAATLAGPTAFNIFQTFRSSSYDVIPNTPEAVPSPGDLVFWEQNASVGTGPAGHVAVFVFGTTADFTSFDQNWPEGSACHEQTHTYDGVVGWFHPRSTNQGAPMATDSLTKEEGEVLYGLTVPGQPINEDFVAKYVGAKLDDYIHALQGDPSVQSYQQSLIDQAKAYAAAQQDTAVAQQDAAAAKSSADAATAQAGSLQSQVADLENQLKKVQAEAQLDQAELKRLQTEPQAPATPIVNPPSVTQESVLDEIVTKLVELVKTRL